jgi:hypothetical protein
MIDLGTGVAGEGGAQGGGEKAARGVPRPQGAGEDRAGYLEPAEGDDQQVGTRKAQRGGRLAQSHNKYKRAAG